MALLSNVSLSGKDHSYRNQQESKAKNFFDMAVDRLVAMFAPRIREKNPTPINTRRSADRYPHGDRIVLHIGILG